MGKERLLPTGKQLFVCDNIFQGEIAGGELSWMRQKYTKKKRKRKRKQQQQQKTNKQTQNFHDSSWGKMSGMEGERQSE